MSLIDDLNREANLQRAKENTQSNDAQLVELELKRIENEKYRTPEYAKFWQRRKSQVLLIRSAIATPTQNQ